MSAPLKPGEVDKWPLPGTPPPTGPARVWIEVELEIARRRLARMQRKITGTDTDADD